ncbi:MAG: hypothetical protein O2931_07010 [Planctomycetota bacterium]|nr:hypothetical protein [Planctomycetota bacterium]MDA1178529.1 hypothetical protein [Planctomycetota bacterium]
MYLFQERLFRRWSASSGLDDSDDRLDAQQLAPLMTAYQRKIERRCSRRPRRALFASFWLTESRSHGEGFTSRLRLDEQRFDLVYTSVTLWLRETICLEGELIDGIEKGCLANSAWE